MKFPPIKATRKSGAEPIRSGSVALGPTLLDFWRWSASDLVDNTQRGVFAEFLVAMAIGALVDGVRESWTPYDLETADGIKVEVKSAAYVQAWGQAALSKIQFAVPKRHGWDAEAGKSELDSRRHADVYVFAFLAHQDQATLDPMDVSQWEFYVLATRTLEEREEGQRSISLGELRKLAQQTPYDRLRGAVEAALRGGVPPQGLSSSL